MNPDPLPAGATPARRTRPVGGVARRGRLRRLAVSVQPVAGLPQAVVDGLAPAVSVALVREQHQPTHRTVPLTRSTRLRTSTTKKNKKHGPHRVF